MTLFKTSILTAIATIIKVITRFVINKLVAIYIGPSGLAMIGQFQNFLSLVMTIAQGAISQGVIKYTAEYRENSDKKSNLFSTALLITLFSSIFVAMFINIFSSDLSMYILKSYNYNNIFIILSSTIILFALNTFLLSILNGEKEIKKYILVNIAGSLFSLVFTSLLIINFKLLGSLYAMVLNQSVIFFVTLFFVIKSSWFHLKYFLNGLDKKSSINLGKYALMAIVSATLQPLSQMIIRDYIGNNLGWDSAGYWQGIWYISTMYLMVITTSLSVYYLPRLSEITDRLELKKEIINGYKTIIPIVSFLALAIYMFREWIIYIAFSNSFIEMEELFKWQLVGDVIKIASWLLSYLMLAKAMTKLFIISEIIFIILWTVLAILGIRYFGIIGVSYAFSLNYLLYFIFIFYVFRKVLK